MKKFLIAILALIPAIVVLALTATAQIIKLNMQVEAKDIIIKNSQNEHFDFNEIYVLDLIGQDCLEIIIYVIPAISYNLNILFEVTEESEGEVVAQRIEDSTLYVIYPTKAGFCDLLIIAENNREVKKTIHFYVKTDVLSVSDTNVIALNNSNKHVGGEKIALDEIFNLTQPTKLFLDCFPVESIGDNFIIWESMNSAIVKIDKNGYAYPNGLGETDIYATITDKAGNIHRFIINVNTNNAIVKLNNVYLSYDIDVTEYLDNNILLVDSYYTSASNNENIYYVKNNQGDIVDTITVTRVLNHEKGIINSDYLDVIFIGNGGYYFNVNYYSYELWGSIGHLTYTSSNPLVAEVSETGFIKPISQGNVTIIAYEDGVEIAVKDINVKAKATTFRLNKSNEQNRVGIKQEYVWAFNWFKEYENETTILDNAFTWELLFTRLNGHLINSYEGLKYNEGSARFIRLDGSKNEVVEGITLFWSVSNSNYASVDQSGNLEFYEAVCGNEVTITATEIVHGIKTRLSRSYTFKFIEDKNAVNVYDSNQFRGANEGYSLTTVLHCNLEYDYLNSPISPYYVQSREVFHLRSSIYGNGKKISSLNQHGNSLFRVRLQAKYVDYSAENIIFEGPLVFENIEFDGWTDPNKPYDKASGNELIENIFEVSYYYWHANHYYNYQTYDYEEESPEMRLQRLEQSPIEFRYCYIHSAMKGISLYQASNVKVIGTIFSNIFFSAIYAEQQLGQISTLLIERVVIRDTNAIGISSILTSENGAFANDAVGSKIIIRGFYDAYTWADINSFDTLGNLMPKDTLMFFGETVADQLHKVIGSAIKDILVTILKEFDLVLDYKGKEYSHLAIFALGMWADTDPTRVIDETGEFEIISFALDKDFEVNISALSGFKLKLSTLEGLSDFESLQKSSHVMSYKFTDNNPRIMPDTRCPSNIELYRRLQGLEN